MFCENDYSSDSSDEDFVPQGTGSDIEDEDDDDVISENEDDENTLPGNKRKAKAGKKQKKPSKGRRKYPLLSSIPDSVEEEIKENEPVEKEVEDKKKEEDLWADFLADVDDKPPAPSKPKPNNSWSTLLGNKRKTPPPSTSIGTQSLSKNKDKKADTKETSTVKVTKIFEFAGEEVRIEEEVAANSAEAKAAAFKQNEKTSKTDTVTGTKRPVGLSGIVNLLDNKKMKLSTLEKSKLDWNSFKSSEGLEEELEKHKKSKSGYLEKQAFLERADLREFELERSIRMGKRSKR